MRSADEANFLKNWRAPDDPNSLSSGSASPCLCTGADDRMFSREHCGHGSAAVRALSLGLSSAKTVIGLHAVKMKPKPIKRTTPGFQLER